jgi:hypothetical protein
VNYEVLDRHVGWFGTFGFRGMVVDEAHFIKNKSSQRSQHVLELSERIRWRTSRPLLMALTGTPLINDIDDFLAIWQFLGWIDDDEPSLELMGALERNGLTPMDPDFYPAARAAVIDLGIVRRRKVDVAADIPARRIADLPVELDGAAGRSIREAERVLARRLVKRYRSALEVRDPGVVHTGVDAALVRRVAGWERQEAKETQDSENVFSMMRRIGQAKAVPAADYAAQLARSAGKVVLFAKHVDVMDAAERTFEQRGVGYVSVRGNQTSAAGRRASTPSPTTRTSRSPSARSPPPASGSTCRSPPTWCSPSSAGPTPSRRRPSTASTASARTSRDRLAHHRRADDRRPHRRAARREGRARGAALDGSDDEVGSSTDVQLEALVALLTDALAEEDEAA